MTDNADMGLLAENLTRRIGAALSAGGTGWLFDLLGHDPIAHDLFGELRGRPADWTQGLVAGLGRDILQQQPPDSDWSAELDAINDLLMDRLFETAAAQNVEWGIELLDDSVRNLLRGRLENDRATVLERVFMGAADGTEQLLEDIVAVAPSELLDELETRLSAMSIKATRAGHLLELARSSADSQATLPDPSTGDGNNPDDPASVTSGPRPAMIAICFDCQLHGFESHPPGAWPDCAEHHVPAPVPAGFICNHFRPEFWESQGFRRRWGDAAVMNWPYLEIMRGAFDENGRTEVRFVILAPYMARRPVLITRCGPEAWGEY